MFRNVYTILSSFLGESKQGGYSSETEQYQFNCPSCADDNMGEPDGKYNLEVNFSLGKFHCWKCSSKGNLSYLIKRWGNKELYRTYVEEIKSIKESGYYDLSGFSDTGTSVTLTGDNEELTLPKTFTPIKSIESCRDKRVIEYLKKRHITQDIINLYNIGYTTWDEEEYRLRNRIIIPSYDSNGFLNYWVGRDYIDSSDGKKTKYCNSSNEKKAIVFQESVINWDSDVILVEGAIDCIYYPNAVSMLGKVLTKDTELFKKLYNKANGRIIICLDSDTKIEETKNIYRLLNIGRLKGKIGYIRLVDHKDFGDLYETSGKSGIISAIRSEKTFSDVELIV